MWLHSVAVVAAAGTVATAAVVAVVVVCVATIVPAKFTFSLRDGSAQITLRAATLRQTLQIKLAVSPITVY